MGDFPNPLVALPLPPGATRDDFERFADDLPAWLSAIEAPRRKLDAVEAYARCESDARTVLARSHGFASWADLTKLFEPPGQRFEAAVDAIVTGDAATLQRLLDEEPELIHARSLREHHATLLHYTSANGVEGYRQKTPANIVAIAKILLDAGADVDATADVYGGGCTALLLAATSVWPERAGVQEALLQTLLDRGATFDGDRIIEACLANGRPRAAAFLASRGAPLNFQAAAALGRIDDVERFFRQAFLWACMYGGRPIVEMLLARGADLRDAGGDGQTPLHCAVIGGQLETVQLLLQHDPPLEAVNVYGGTVLGQALWSAAHDGDRADYAAMIEMLIAAGAKVPPRHVPVTPEIDALLRRYGSEPEPAWHWLDE